MGDWNCSGVADGSYGLVGASLGLVVGGGASRSLVVVGCDRSSDRDVTTTSFAFPGTSAIRSSSPSSLAFSSSSSLLFPPSSFPSSPFPSLSSLCFSSSSSSMVPSKPANSYSVAICTRFARFASRASRRDLMAVNVVRMWSGNIPGLSWHHLSTISRSFASCSLMLLFVVMASFMAQLITIHCVFQPSINRCWPGRP